LKEKKKRISVGEWDTKLVSFAKASLVKHYKNHKANNEKDEYYRALIACSNIFTSEKTSSSLDDDLLFTVQVYYPEFGAAILTSVMMTDPLTWKVYIVGLDNCQFTLDANGWNNSICDGGEGAFLSCAHVPKNKLKAFLKEVDDKLGEAETKTENERHSSNSDGRIQHTPGFILSTCIKVLCAPKEENVVYSNHDFDPPNIVPQCSGFTDVGMHTGCNPRDTMLPLVLSILKITLKHGMMPPLVTADHCYARFEIEYYLSLATEVKYKSHFKP
jgi:hypothetical protein